MAKNEGFVDNETEKRAKIRYHNKKAKGHSIEDEKEIRAATEAWHHTHVMGKTTIMKESG